MGAPITTVQSRSGKADYQIPRYLLGTRIDSVKSAPDGGYQACLYRDKSVDGQFLKGRKVQNQAPPVPVR